MSLPLENQDIIMTGLQSWDIEIGSNAIDIARELSKKNRVLYINYALDRITVLKEKNNPKIRKRLKDIKEKGSQLIPVEDNIWTLEPGVILESINKIPLGFIYDFFNKVNSKKIANTAKKAIQELSFKNPIIFIDNDFFRSVYLKDLIPNKLTIYYLRDNLTVQDYFKKHGIRVEQQMMKKADHVMANSVYLADYARQFNKNAHYVGQGFDTSNFLSKKLTNTPTEIKPMKGPVIGYLGALISMRLDISIIRHIAQERPHWNIVLIGPEDDDFKQSELHRIPNVYFLGKKPIEDAPSYINAFDVCINPQGINPLTIGNYPRKIDEYLALGKPVVATKTKAMESFSSHTYLCENKEEYIGMIEKAIQQNTEEKIAARKSFALSHTWENSVKAMNEAILESS